MNGNNQETGGIIDNEAARQEYYLEVLDAIASTGLSYGIIGGVAQKFYGGGRLSTNDLDIALLPQDVGTVLQVIRSQNPNWRVDHKHPDWLNQVWSGDGLVEPAHSVDIIHRHSTGLTEANPWWFQGGVVGNLYDKEFTYVAPEALVLTKSLLFARRHRDLLDAIQVAQMSNQFREFEWALLRTELHEDWRLAYLIGVLTEILYGKQTIQIPTEEKLNLHNALTNKPIPGPVRGNYFAYDIGGEGAGEPYTWEQGFNGVVCEDPESAILGSLYNWSRDHTAFVNASRILVGNENSLDWDKLVSLAGPNWRFVLATILSTEILYGHKGSDIIPAEIKASLSGMFVEGGLEGELGTTLFPDRF